MTAVGVVALNDENTLTRPPCSATTTLPDGENRMAVGWLRPLFTMVSAKPVWTGAEAAWIVADVASFANNRCRGTVVGPPAIAGGVTVEDNRTSIPRSATTREGRTWPGRASRIR